MGRLVPAFALVLFCAGSPASAQGVAHWRTFISEASSRFGIPAEWIEQVMLAESGGHTHRRGLPTTSHAGAMGLMQLMPGTWAEIRARLRLGQDPHAPRDNIIAGTYYLRQMYDRFGHPGLFAAYNAGPARYGAYLAGRAQLPAETRSYIAAVTDYGDRPASASALRPPVNGGLFFVRNPPVPSSDEGELRDNSQPD